MPLAGLALGFVLVAGLSFCRPQDAVDPGNRRRPTRVACPKSSAWSLYTQSILLVELAAVLLLVALLGALLIARRPQMTMKKRMSGKSIILAKFTRGSNMVPTNYYLILSAMIFAIGAVGVLSRRNALIIFMCVEMMLNSVNLTLVAMSRQWNNLNGQLFVFMIMAVAAAEVAVGLAILIAHYHHATAQPISMKSTC